MVTSCSFSLTRPGDWAEETNPIILEEVESVLDKLPSGFRIDRRVGASMTLPTGRTHLIGSGGVCGVL